MTALRGRHLAAACATALAAGAVLPLALAPFDIWPLALLSVGALYWLLGDAATGRRALLLGWLYGVGKYGVGASWIYVSIHTYGNTSAPVAAGMVLLFVAGMALFQALLGVAAWAALAARPRSAGASALLGAVIFAGLWTTMEWLLSWFLTGFPWLYVGYAFLDTPLAHGLAPVGGVLLVSCAAVLSGAALADVVRARRWPAASALGIAVGFWLLALALAQVSWTERGAARSVALVQGDVPQESKWDPARLGEWRDRYAALSARAWDHDIVVWPEAAVPDYYRRSALFVDAIKPADSGDLVQGTLLAERSADGGYDIYNGAASTGGGLYRKRRLVPFGDYLPFGDALRGVVGFFDLAMPRTRRGAEQQPLLRAGDLRLAMAICYEIAYPSLVARDAARADLLVTVSNDTWFGASIGPLQHAQMARMRALENGRYLLRATNNGVTMIVDERGNVVDRLPQFERGVLIGTVYSTSGRTPFARYVSMLGVH